MIAREIPWTAPLDANRRQQHALHAHPVHCCKPERRFGDFVRRAGDALEQDQALRFRRALPQLEKYKPDGNTGAFPSNRSLDLGEMRVRVCKRD